MKALSRRRIILLIVSFVAAISFWFCLPEPLFKVPYATALTDSKGELLQAKIAADGQWRFEPNKEVPQKFADCIVRFEDKRFYYHLGFDPIAFARAMYLNLKRKAVVSGGSTLSMQVIRLSRNKPRTVWEKCIEILLAIRLELGYSKAEILQLYAAHAPFGGNVVGLEAAAWRYFGRNASQLSWGEMASLAVLPNSPSLVRPDKNRDLLKNKRNRLLLQLKEDNKLDEETYLLALQEPLPAKPLQLPNLAPNLVNSLIEGKLGPKPTNAYLKTTLNKAWQMQTQEILEMHHQRLKANGVNNVAALVLDIERNEIKAYVGNVFHPEDPEIESYVDMIPAQRSPGSTLKPLLYAAMLQDGLLLPKSLVADIPTQVAGYMPQNFDLQYDGAVPANEALARSLNVPMVRMLQEYKTERFYYLLRKLGLKSLNKGASHYGLSLILGGGENSMWEISGVYASLARQLNHYGKNSGMYDAMDLSSPKVLVEEKEENTTALSKDRILSSGAVWHTFEAMQDLTRPGEEQNWTQYISSRRVAWKTGTSFGFRDAWAVGLTSRYLICVWAGNADGEGRPGLTGVSAAAPVLFDLVKMIPASSWFETPFDDLKKELICSKSGDIAGQFCEVVDTILCVKTKVARRPCKYHQLIHLDASKRYRVNSTCEQPSNMMHATWFVLPPAMEWFYKSKDASYANLPPWKPGCSAETYTPMMEIIYPKRMSSLYIPKELDGKEGKAVIEAAHRNNKAKIHWYIDGIFIGSTQEFHKMAISPSSGKHMLLIEDENGERIELPFEIVRNH